VVADSNWYYLDDAGQQVGPVAIEALRAAVQSRTATMATLVWRDGMASWRPLGELAAELGLAAPSADVLGAMPPPAPQAWVTPAADANPYRAPDSVSDDSRFASGAEVVYAGFWRRWAALFLDQMILAIPLFVVFFTLAFMVGAGSGGEPNPFAVIAMQFAFYAVWLAAALMYYAGLESSEAQATFGKRALGIKVTDAEGRRLSFKHAAGRWMGAALSYMSFYIGFLMAGFTERKQALHDYIAGTLVVDRWAFTSFPERQQRGLSGCLIIFIIFVVGSLLLIPIFFAIAIAQYEEFLRRARNASLYEPEGATVCVVTSLEEAVARCERRQA
jgi:uncharacterized RDD family membrane protein YckC